jgi:hypothetical protein
MAMSVTNDPLDATIGLEALCSDGSAQEINYKLRLRIAALLQLSEEEYDPIKVFDTVRNIYKYRSAVIHGKGKLDKVREITSEASPPIPTISKAIEYLREILKVLIHNPEYLDTEKLDEELLLEKLSSRGKSEIE